MSATPTPNEPPVTREAFVASRPEMAELIDGLTGPAALLDALGSAPPLAAKGTLLGDLRKPALSAVIERYTSRLNSYLWGLVYSDQATGDDLTAKVRAASDEARDALVQLFAAAEPLRGPGEMADVMAAPVNYLSRGMTAEAKAIFGDPAEGWREWEHADEPDDEPAPVKTAAMAPADDDEDEPDEDDDEGDPGPIRVGNHVKCVKGLYRGVVGKVKSVHRVGVVPDVDDDVMATKDMPAARVQCYKAMGDGHRETEHHVAAKVAHLEKIEDLKPPKRGKPVPPKKAKGLEIEILPEEVRTDEEVAAARLAAKRAAMSPEVMSRMAKSVLDELTGVV